MTVSPERQRRLVLAVSVGVAVLLLAAALVVSGVVRIGGGGSEMVDRWVAAMADPAGDRGWSLLAADTRERGYGGDEAAYRADAEAVDWSEVVWAPATGYSDDGHYFATVGILSHPSTLPRFIVERGLATASCVDDLPHGLWVLIPRGWDTGISGGAGLTGSARECAETFYQRPGPLHDPFDLVGMAWGSPGPNQRVGVVDGSGLVVSVGAGREDPPRIAPAVVSLLEPRELLVAWQGSPCDANTTLRVAGDSSHLEIVIERGVEDATCTDEDVGWPREATYEVMLELRKDIDPDRVDVEVTERAAGARSATPTPTSSPAAPSATVAFTGETPGPDAVVPAGYPVIPGLSIGEVALAAESLGIPCLSHPATIPEGGEVGWALWCEGESPDGSVLYTMTALYWTMEHTGSLDASVLPTDSSPSVRDPTAAERFFSVLVQLPHDDPNPTDTREWLLSVLDDPGCADIPCMRTVGGTELQVQVGENGARGLVMQGLETETPRSTDRP